MCSLTKLAMLFLSWKSLNLFTSVSAMEATTAYSRSKERSMTDQVESLSRGIAMTVNESHSLRTEDRPRSNAIETSRRRVNRRPSSRAAAFQIGQTFSGISFLDNYNYNKGATYSPPDPICAASRTTLVAVANEVVEMRNKTGTLLSKLGLPDFFVSLNYQGGITDPKIVYDEYEDRFVIILLNILGPGKVGLGNEQDLRRLQLPTNVTGNTTILMAVSKSGSPTSFSDWYFQAIDSLEVNVTTVDSYLIDYPGLGVGPDAVYITGNLYSYNTKALAGVRLWIVAKTSFYSGGPISYNKYNPYAGGVPLLSMPALVHGGPIGSNIGTYLVGFDSTQSSHTVFVVTKVTNPLGTPSFSSNSIDLGVIDLNLALVLLPPSPQLNSTARIDALDRRVLDATWRNNSLWFTSTIISKSASNFNQTTAYWVRVDTNSFTVVDQGEIGGEDLGNGTFTSFASVDVNSQGAAAFGFSASNPSIYPGAYVVGRNPTDPAGTVSSTYTVHQGIDYYVRTNGGSRNRWGDYSGISVDPVDDSFWVFNLYADKRGFMNGLKEDGVWNTAWARFISTSTLKTASPTAIPTSLPTSSPTATPTLLPTSSPTATSTLLPTSSSTATPTLLPTSSPTSTPTSLRTPKPTTPPTPLPTLQPTTAAPAISKHPTVVIKVPKGYCFSEVNIVEVQDKGLIQMHHLQIGDMVKDAHGNMVRVYSFGHYQPKVQATYLQIHVEGLAEPLEISQDHLVFVNHTAVPASVLRPGDRVDVQEATATTKTQARISSIRVVIRKGAYAPFTTSGTILVNGVAASSYVTLQPDSSVLQLGRQQRQRQEQSSTNSTTNHYHISLSMHWLAHVFQSPHRVWCQLIGIHVCRNTETYNEDGISNYVQMPYHVFGWLVQQNQVTMTVIFVPALLVGLFSYGIECGGMYLFAVVVVVAGCMWKRCGHLGTKDGRTFRS